MKTKIVAFAVVVLFGVLVARTWGVWPFGGVVVVVDNVGSVDFESCVVNVTGNSYDLGALVAGESVSTRVSPVGESHIELELIERGGLRQNLVVDCYFEQRGYSGTVQVEIDNGMVKRVDSDIGLSFP